MRTSVWKLLLTVAASAMFALGGVAGHTAAGGAATGGPDCWDWSPPDQ